MEEELRKKMYDMHGTVERLDQKMDSIIETQGRLDSDVENLDKQISEVSEQADSNQKKLYGVFLLGGAGTTVASIVVAVATSGFP